MRAKPCAKDRIFELMPWQIPFFNDVTSPVVVLAGGAGGGKSHVALMKLHTIAQRYANTEYAIIRKTLQSLKSITLPFFERHIINGLDGIKHNKQTRVYTYPNGSLIHYLGMDDEKAAERIRGLNLSCIFIDEGNAFIHDDINEAIARIRDNKAKIWQMIISTNPDNPTHFINEYFIKGGHATVYKSNAWQNKHNPKQYLDFLDSLTGVKRLRLRDGIWAQAEGAVFPEWEESKHVRSMFDNPLYIPKGWQRLRAIDFGYKNPFVCLWMARNPETNVVYIYKELRQTGLLVEDAAKIINDHSLDENYIATVADHDAEGRATLAKYGIHTVAAFKDISTGIEQMRTRIRNDKLIYLDNALIYEDPALREQYEPLTFAKEIQTYIWEPPKPGKPPKELPVKKNDHGIDAARYGIAYFDGLTSEAALSYEEMMQIAKTPSIQSSLNTIFSSHQKMRF